MNIALRVLATLACALIFVTLVAVVFQIISGASLAFHREGLGMLTRHNGWNPAGRVYGAWPLIYGSLVTSIVSLVLATILGVAIGLFLSILAPKRLAAAVGPLVEMLAAIPSTVIGLIGIIVVAPVVANHIEPALHDVLGFIPLFGAPQSYGNSLFTACLVLTFMVLPIIAALTRDIFTTVPQELIDGANALGATTWEMIRGVVLPTTTPGIISACMLGFGRALGEAIAVTMVIGGQTVAHLNIFLPGDTLASRIAEQFDAPVNQLHLSTLYYLAVVLVLFGILSNVTARVVGRRMDTSK